MRTARAFVSFPLLLVAIAVAGLLYLVCDGGMRMLWREWSAR